MEQHIPLAHLSLLVKIEHLFYNVSYRLGKAVLSGRLIIPAAMSFSHSSLGAPVYPNHSLPPRVRSECSSIVCAKQFRPSACALLFVSSSFLRNKSPRFLPSPLRSTHYSLFTILCSSRYVLFVLLLRLTHQALLHALRPFSTLPSQFSVSPFSAPLPFVPPVPVLWGVVLFYGLRTALHHNYSPYHLIT